MGNSPYPEAEVVQMAGRIGLGEFIATLKNGLDTEMDPSGRRLSKSITRKILFLRALVSRPKLILLEDPWEGMEDISRQQMLQMIKEKLGNATVIIATNDEAYRIICDKVFELDNGTLKVLL